MTEPEPRSDGRCFVCEKQRPVADDPFCSSRCCHRYYGVVFVDTRGRNLDDLPARSRTSKSGEKIKILNRQRYSLMRRGYEGVR